MILRRHPLSETFGGRAFRGRSLPTEWKVQVLTKARPERTLRVGDLKPLPALARSHKVRIGEFQAAALIEKARDDLRAPALFQKGAALSLHQFKNGGSGSLLTRR